MTGVTEEIAGDDEDAATRITATVQKFSKISGLGKTSI
jgi:hypothetical protein